MLLDRERRATTAMDAIARIMVARKPASAAEAAVPHACKPDLVAETDCAAARTALLVHLVRRSPVATGRRERLLRAGTPSTVEHLTAANVVPNNDIATDQVGAARPRRVVRAQSTRRRAGAAAALAEAPRAVVVVAGAGLRNQPTRTLPVHGSGSPISQHDVCVRADGRR